jgi:hypothetical protein
MEEINRTNEPVETQQIRTGGFWLGFCAGLMTGVITRPFVTKADQPDEDEKTHGVWALIVFALSAAGAYFLWSRKGGGWPVLMLAEALAVVSGISLGWVLLGGIVLVKESDKKAVDGDKAFQKDHSTQSSK